jgi:hypothetical protein
MKIVIPYKESSSRCEEKNTKPFYGGDSILEYTVKKFEDAGHTVILACIPSHSSAVRHKNMGLQTLFLPRKQESFSHVVTAIGEQLDYLDANEPICFWLLTEITFFLNNDINDFIECGEINLEFNNQATVKVNRLEHFLINDADVGINFDHGPWFKYSQELSTHYILAFSSVTTPEILSAGWTYGPKFQKYIAKEPYVDINTEDEFKTAQALFLGWDKC